MTRLNVVRGCLFGALAGDAAGATLEFLGRAPDKAEVENTLEMVGGGCGSTAPGQITDDGELALCLARAIAGAESFPIEKVAAEYLGWLRSPPFDIGGATSAGLGGGEGAPDGAIHEGMWRAAGHANMGSKANGALMRVTPLGAWGWRVSAETLVAAAYDECRLTHPNPTCQASSTLYCLAIRHLALNPGDAGGAVAVATAWAPRLGVEEVADWLRLAAEGADVGYYPSAGFVKYGFVHAFRHLGLGTSYLDAARDTLRGGGDTDTNACIVGGLVGAAHGEAGIPRAMIEAVASCDTARGRPRPAWLQARGQIDRLADALSR